MNNLTPIEYQSQRILITQQIAESYGTDERRISENYTRNQSRYVEGKHFYCLEGEALRQFKNDYAICGIAPTVNKFYLWTEKGAWLHAKSLGTDEAWNAYEMLVDEYYSIKEQRQVSCIEDLIIMQAQAMKDMRLEVAETKLQVAENTQQVQAIKEALLPTDKEWRKGINEKINQVAKACDADYYGVRSSSYKLLEQRGACNLSRRVQNLKNRLSESGATKTTIDKACKLDAIESDKRLKEIYSTIVREMVVKYVA